MMDQQKGNFIFQCDECGEVLDTQTSNFDAAINKLKRDGWKARKVDNDWKHYCDCCHD